jgi:NodT family efflux transporter outer membrane factor (OMF) lipoprotein
MKKLKLHASCILATLFLSACSIGPDYQKTSIVLNGGYKEAPKGWKIAEPKETPNRTWWTVFNDPYLNALMCRVNVSNQNIISAIAQYKQALALVDETRANYWPVVVVDASDTRSQTSNSTVNSRLFAKGPSTTYIVEPSATWSPDIFGVVRRAVEASEAGAEASAAQLAATRLSMQALLAQTYFQLRSADQVQKLLDDNVISYKKSLELTKYRYASGVASRLDIAQADSQLQTVITQALDNGINRAQYEHAIAVLVGSTPENFGVSVQNAKLAMPVIPRQVPSVLLERRPDIAQAERLVAQANANIGVAIAAYFPILTLTGAGGYSSSKYSNVFTQPAQIWSIAAAAAETVFNGGLTAAQVQAARASYDQTVASYKQTVLTALQQVEDNLVSLRILDSEVNVQARAVASAELAEKITINQYKSGVVPYSSVTLAQATSYTAKVTAASIDSRRMVATVGLIQALGGDL